MNDDSKRQSPWRGSPPPAPIPQAGQRLSETVELEREMADPNLDFATGPRKPPLAAPPVSGRPPEPPAPPAKPAAAADEDEPEMLEFSARLEDSEMDMTPMIDIVFQLLIFFMVTAAFSMQKSKQMPAPKDDKPSTSAVPKDQDNDSDVVTVFIDSYNTYRVQTPEWDEEAPSDHDMLVKLRKARTAGTTDGRFPTVLMIKAHENCMYEKVITALDAGADVGMEEIKLQTLEQDEE